MRCDIAVMAVSSLIGRSTGDGAISWGDFLRSQISRVLAACTVKSEALINIHERSGCLRDLHF